MKVKLLQKFLIVLLIVSLLSSNVMLCIINVFAEDNNTSSENGSNPIMNAISEIMLAGETSNEMSAEEIIVKACELLGKPYHYGYKGYNGIAGNGTYSSDKLYSAEEICDTIDGCGNRDGIDCSGLVFWTLASLGYKTKGYAMNWPVPYDTYLWFIDEGVQPQISKNGGEYVNINVLKRNESITEELRYYEYLDENSQEQEIPMGTVIVSKNTSAGSSTNHAWLTLGNLETTDVNEVANILKRMGAVLPEDISNLIVKTDDNCTYWRIEASGAGSVSINNGNPSHGAQEGNGKIIGPIYAFQFAEETPYEGSYQLNLKKVMNDENGQVVSGVTFKVNGTETSATGADGIVSLGETTITKDNYATPDTYTISEIKVENNDRLITLAANQSIVVNVTKTPDDTNKTYTVDAKFANGTDSTEVTLSNGDKVTAKIQQNGNIITVVIPNKEEESGSYQLKLKKINADTNKGISGVKFTVGSTINTVVTAPRELSETDSNGEVSLETVTIDNDNYKNVDTYEITEIDLGKNDGLISIAEPITVTVKKEKDQVSRIYSAKATFDNGKITKEITLTNGEKVIASIVPSGNTMTIRIPNKEEQPDSYSLQIKKVIKDTQKPVSGVKFKVKINGNETPIETSETDATNGLTSVVSNVEVSSENVAVVDKYEITEIDLGNNALIKVVDPIIVYVKKSMTYGTGKFVVAPSFSESEVVTTLENVKLSDGTTTTVTLGSVNNVITVTIPNVEKQGNYTVVLEKVDKFGEKIEKEAIFTINGEEAKTEKGNLSIASAKEITKDGQEDTYEIIEKQAPAPYGIYKNAIDLKVLGKEAEKGFEINKDETVLMIGEEKIEKGKKSSDGYVSWNISGDKITITLENREFDLALYKWVTTTLVTEDGKTTEYESGHTQDDKSNVVNVSIPKEKLNDVVVKFKYQIKVENQGELDGYVKGIKDHIPEGLKFVEEDNKEFGWVMQEDGTITTDYLKGTLLKQGETAEVTVVLTWINGSENLGQKVNFAEISEDYNDYGDCDDRDSTPNNFKGEIKEDDEDSDVVMLNIKTGDTVDYTYLMLGLVCVSIVAFGTVGIKKFVL